MIEEIESTLDKLLDPSRFSYSPLILAARYAVLSGGKRFRPQLVLATAALFNVPQPQALIPACAIELVHTYSLIHDDLPCMDNDDLRRGVPTLHKVYPEGHALLTGNFLLTYAYELLAQAPELFAEQKIDLISTLSRHIGAEGMIGGQAQDLALTGKAIDSSMLLDVHQRKTAALITAALEFGAIIGKTHERTLLRQLGNNIGLLLQLLDDLQDPADAAQGRPSLLSLLGREKATQQAHTYQTTIFATLRRWPDSLLLKLLQNWIHQAS